MKRREFIALVGGVGLAWPLSALAQQSNRVRRIGVFIGATKESDPEALGRINALRQGLEALGLTEGHNLQIDFRFGGGDQARIQALAAELVNSAPDLIVANSSPVVHDEAEIERAIVALARNPGAGLISAGDPFTVAHRALIMRLAEQHRMPAIYQFRQFAAEGGLMSYGPDTHDIFRRSASYVDRILKGEKPADLPAQAPTRFELVINLKTAKALGITVPSTLLARADEVIE